MQFQASGVDERKVLKLVYCEYVQHSATGKQGRRKYNQLFANPEISLKRRTKPRNSNKSINIFLYFTNGNQRAFNKSPSDLEPWPLCESLPGLIPKAMKLTTNMYAPIVPGFSAAGFALGVRLEHIEPKSLDKLTFEVQTFPGLKDVLPWHIYSSADLYLRFIDGELKTIGVMGALSRHHSSMSWCRDKSIRFRTCFG